MSQQRILVTGAAGYIGSVLCRQLLAEGHFVRGLDSLLFGGESLLEILAHPHFDFQKGDIRDAKAVESALQGMDAVIHLAAIVGDPACKQFSDLATETMDVASRALYLAAGKAGISRFVFASTCSNYGQMEGEQLLDENAPLRPQSHYARLKVGFEEFLMAQEDGPQWSILRFATVYGSSPRPRFDLTVNHFSRDLALGLELLVFGQHQWRPYCHVQDLAKALRLSLAQDAAQFHRSIYNIGDSSENYSKAMILEAILQQLPDGQVRYGGSPDADSRNYRVDFGKAASQLGFQISKRVPDGIAEILQLIRSGLLSDPFSSKYQNA